LILCLGVFGGGLNAQHGQQMGCVLTHFSRKFIPGQLNLKKVQLPAAT
jgi:hypothetical protein